MFDKLKELFVNQEDVYKQALKAEYDLDKKHNDFMLFNQVADMEDKYFDFAYENKYIRYLTNNGIEGLFHSKNIDTDNNICTVTLFLEPLGVPNAGAKRTTVTINCLEYIEPEEALRPLIEHAKQRYMLPENDLERAIRAMGD